MFRDNLSVPSSIVKGQESEFLTLEDRAEKLSRNVGKKLPLLTA
jgi:hypothetical protein